VLTGVVAALALVGAGSAFGASDGIIRAERGPVRATLRFEKAGYEYRRLELSVVRAGTAFSQRLGQTYFERPKLRVRDLDADGEAEVWVDTYTGGAHCCDVTRFFRYDAAVRTYRVTYHNWGNVGYRAKNIDGRDSVELVSNDDRFAYVFTSFAGSFFPLRFWHFDGGRLRDVTRRFLGQVELDAQQLWRTYEKNRGPRADVRGVLAAWQADQYLLGLEDEGWAMLAAIRERGELGPRADLAGWPQGRAYIRALRAYLRKLGYAG